MSPERNWRMRVEDILACIKKIEEYKQGMSYVDYAPVFKNIPAFWTETAGQIASPREYTANDLPQNFRALRQESMYSSPWQPG